jgi:hypothetical protein
MAGIRDSNQIYRDRFAKVKKDVQTARLYLCKFNWLGRQDSNLRMPVPKTGALPLGDAPLSKMLTCSLVSVLDMFFVLPVPVD